MLKKYKKKSNKSTQKRFKLTKNNKIKFFPSGKNHGMHKKTRKKNRALKKSKILLKSTRNTIKKMLFCL